MKAEEQEVEYDASGQALPGYALVEDVSLFDTLPTAAAARPQARSGHHWRMRGTALTLLMLVALNVALQLNRRFLDVMSSGTGGAAGYATDADIMKLQECESLGHAPNVFLMGSSRAEDGEDAPRVDAVVRQQFGLTTLSCNLAMSGSTFASDYFMLKRALEDGLTPKLIVENLFEFNINAHSDAATYGLGHAVWLADLSDTAALGTLWGGSPQGIGQTLNYVVQKSIPLYGDRIALLKAVCQSARVGPCGLDVPGIPWSCRACYLNDPNHGWLPIDGHTIADPSPEEQLALAHELSFFATNYLQNFQLIKGWPPYLVRLVDLAQAHHIQLALIVSPLHQLYRNLLTPAQWRAIMDYWSTYARGVGIPFFDESQAPGYADSDFRDPHHLSVAGSAKFSAWMATAIVGPQLALSNAPR